MESTADLILKKGNTLHTETTFLDLHLCINEGQIQTFLYDKRKSYNSYLYLLIQVALYHQK